jgi:hypothetical protein
VFAFISHLIPKNSYTKLGSEEVMVGVKEQLNNVGRMRRESMVDHGPSSWAVMVAWGLHSKQAALLGGITLQGKQILEDASQEA